MAASGVGARLAFDALPRSATLRAQPPAELAAPHELRDTPFFPQTAYHCGPAALATALGNIPDDIGHLGEWLQQVPAALQNAVRLRIEGERVALPGPGITPYLVGLLVLLGMLGTFLGMVVTLKGAVMALESTTDLATIRAALAAPEDAEPAKPAASTGDAVLNLLQERGLLGSAGAIESSPLATRNAWRAAEPPSST